MKYKLYFLTGIYFLIAMAGFAQKSNNSVATGKLFIIGGGSRSADLMKSLIATAQLKENDYIVVLPMSSAEPDSSFYFIEKDLAKVCSNTITNLNFTSQLVTNKSWLDSLGKAKLIFITGGDQNRFMKIVLNTPVQQAIAAAYAKGATIAGTSAGAAVMSQQMITGSEFSGDTVRSGSFKKIQYHLVEIKEGLGLIKNAIIDQHFIARSRYNRLLSVLAEYPSYPCIGIDEGTAIIVQGKKLTVAGEGQVIKLSLPPKRKSTVKPTGLVNMRNVQLDILVAGDVVVL